MLMIGTSVRDTRYRDKVMFRTKAGEDTFQGWHVNFYICKYIAKGNTLPVKAFNDVAIARF